jgi:outer membrane protein OmpA-like peptidoglycan-associated protein/DNA-binding SARP family transcriptional activator
MIRQGMRVHGPSVIVRRVAAVVVVAVMVGAVPWALIAVAGSPLPDRLPAWKDVDGVLARSGDDALVLAALRVAAWLLWAAWTVLLAAESIAQLKGRTLPPLPGVQGPQRLAAFLITSLTAAVLGVSAGRTSPVPATPPTLAAAVAGPHVDAAHHEAGGRPPAAQQHAAVPSARPGHLPSAQFTSPPPRPRAGPDPTDPAAAPSAHLPQQRTLTVRFGFDSAQLSAAARATLAHTARSLRHQGDPAHPVLIVGHTDTLGNADYNRHLSLRRARAVREVLSSSGADGFPITVSGQGEAQPVAGETRADGSDDPAGRARNRRVEITYTLQTTNTPRPNHPKLPPPTPTAEPRIPASSAGPGAPPSKPPPTTATTPQPSRSPRPGPQGGGGVASPNSAAPPPPGSSHRPTTAPPPPAEDRPVAVALPSGAWAGMGLAAVIAVTLALLRLHRRRRHTPQAHTTASGTAGADSNAEPRGNPAASATVRALRRAHLARTSQADHPLTDTELAAADFTADPPTHLTVGIRDDQEVSVALAGLSVGLTGPAALDVVRAIATELIGRAHPARVHIITPRAVAQTLFGAGNPHTPRAPGLVVTDDMQAALRHLQEQIMHRARLMADQPDSTLEMLRTTHPDEPLPALVIIADPADASDRWAGALDTAVASGDRYGIGAVLLGPWPSATTCHLDADARVTHADGPQQHTWQGAQLFHLTHADTTDLLAVITQARHPQDTESTPISHPAVPAQQEPSGQPESTRAPAPATRTSPTPASQDQASLAHASPSPGTPSATVLKTKAAPPASEQTRPVRLQLLGTLRVDTTQGEVTTGLRRSARELLALLAANPAGITRDASIEAMWPDRDPQAASKQFHTAINNARQVLRQHSGLPQPMFIIHAASRYRLDHHLIQTDLQELTHALDTAAHTTDNPTRITALRRVAELYAGDLAIELTSEWAETERERLRRAATDALTQLAQLLEKDHPDQALAALEQAFTHDPYSEPLARTLMTTQAKLGRPDAVRRTYQLLTHHLADLDVDPDKETQALLTTLLRNRK